MPAILWPDPEAALINYLRPAIVASALTFAADVAVGRVLPSPRPEYAVTVRSDGGPVADSVFADVRFGLNVWAPTKAEAVDLAAYVTALVGVAHEADTPFANATVAVAFEIPEDSGQPHLYTTATLRLRGSDI